MGVKEAMGVGTGPACLFQFLSTKRCTRKGHNRRVCLSKQVSTFLFLFFPMVGCRLWRPAWRHWPVALILSIAVLLIPGANTQTSTTLPCPYAYDGTGNNAANPSWGCASAIWGDDGFSVLQLPTLSMRCSLPC